LPETLGGPPRFLGERCSSLYDLRWQEATGVQRFSCCALNGPRGLPMLWQWAVMRAADGPVVNYYGPSQITVTTPQGRSVVLRQDTDYPIGGAIHLIVTPQLAERFTLRLRIPGWSTSPTVVVNGQPADRGQPGTYLALDRVWSPGDVVDVAFDMRPRFVS